ncbi:signal peptide peptidase SppA [Vespertiliibacter pulmonis]|uniref:Protease-4 n=1 Tax=Vespertiliibacter pulmonis TaxID=1443036 RepID=A0A3N4WCC4_9PAST|nr:signal peptide peptidase SppA [Vespertiliibacter pulmonis]QLB21198.1 signal peptide peptidase SppA [Vespertiliibacter pulmonis]RPE83690.1 protease-4 [Vespertiliibacter pulmonis]
MLAIFKLIYRVFRCIREFVLSLFFVLFVMVCFVFVSLLQSGDSEATKVTEFQKGALRLDLDGYLADNHDEFGQFNRLVRSKLGGERTPSKISTFDVVRAIDKAQNDEKITGLVLDLRNFDGGDFASLEFIGKAIENFKSKNKEVIAVGESYSQSQYFLASFADKIYLNKAGFVDLHGLNYSTLYFKSLLEKIDVVPHIFRVGTYKSAVEPFLRNDMSPEAKENANLWLSTLWKNFKTKVAENRHIPVGQVLPDISQYIEQYKLAKGDDAQYVLNRNLVTELMTDQKIHQMLLNKFGKDTDGEFNHIDFLDYVESLPDRFKVKGKDKIAVINVEGEITWGKSDNGNAGSQTIVELLRKAREDNDVKGVILRINSPGGSATASELIRQEVAAIQGSGKPVVASMGGMAASGGYWIAATSDKIIASPNTLTGSIGIFGLAVSYEKAAKNLGISQDGISTSPLAQAVGFKTLSKEQGEIIQISIENGYDRFLTLVSSGRKMSKSEVDKVAQGQVWLGETALKKGLVDELGDFDTAYQAVTTLVNQQCQKNGKEPISQFVTQWFVEQDNDLISQIMRDFNMHISANIKLTQYLGLSDSKSLQKSTDLLTKFNDPKQTYLYCLNCGTVK